MKERADLGRTDKQNETENWANRLTWREEFRDSEFFLFNEKIER